MAEEPSPAQTEAPPPGGNTVKGMLYITVTSISGSVLLTITRFLTHTMHPFEITFFRALFSLLSFAPFFVRQGLKPLKSDNKKWHLLRGAIQVLQLSMGVTAVKMTAVSKFTALRFTGPLFATLLTLLFLGEKVRMRRIAALLFGFLGALVILRPGVVPLELGALLTIGSAAAWAVISIIVKILTRTDSSITITIYSVIFMTPIAFIIALPVLTMPTWQELGLLIVIGLLNSIGHVCRAEAFKAADLSAVLPVEFSRLIWISLLGFFLFGEVPEIWTWLGGIMIFSANLYIAIRERKLKGTTKPPAMG
ncbi:MAG: DMT family transporter [Rhodospirillales bacterium]